jgi:AcrR family transcriptional regulator
VPRPKIYDDELRQRLLDEAGRVVAEHGLDALTLRRIAADAGTSTSAIYTLIGGRDQVIRELFLAAYRSFGAAQLAAPMTGDTPADLRALAIAYRSWSSAHPYLYQVMFGNVLGEVELTAEQRRDCDATMGPLRGAVAAGLASGALVGGTEDELAIGFWGLVHGLASLELTAGVELPPAARDRVFDLAVSAMVRGWQPDRHG